MNLSIPDERVEVLLPTLMAMCGQCTKKKQKAALSFLIDLMVKQQQDRIKTAYLLEHGTYQEISDFADLECSPGFYRFQLLTKLQAMEEADAEARPRDTSSGL